MQNQSIPQPLVSFNNLSIDEANAIFAALEELPFKRVGGLINKLVQQVNQQLNPAPAPAPAIDGGSDGSSESASDASTAPGLSAPE